MFNNNSKIPRLEMHAELVDYNQNSPTEPLLTAVLLVYVENVGTKKAEGFTWQVGVQQISGTSVRAFSTEPGGQLAADPLDLNDQHYRLFRNRVHSDLYKGRLAKVCRLVIQPVRPSLQMTLLFQVIWDDGEFPGNGYKAQVIEFTGAVTD